MLRREARQEILKALYRREFLRQADSFNSEKLNYGDQKDFVHDIYFGTVEHFEEIDELIGEFASGWSVDRLAILDRNILRMATYELLFYDKTPPEIVINEAVELSKKFGTEKSPSFVNGILDRIWKEKATQN